MGTFSNFAGNIYSLQSITLTTSVIQNGKLIALNGAVTLDSNIVNNCGDLFCLIPNNTISNNTIIALYNGSCCTNNGCLDNVNQTYCNSFPNSRFNGYNTTW